MKRVCIVMSTPSGLNNLRVIERLWRVNVFALRIDVLRFALEVRPLLERSQCSPCADALTIRDAMPAHLSIPPGLALSLFALHLSA